MTEYLTTREVAELLRIKERKVYSLASAGKIPCSKAMGKLLFPQAAIETWLAEGRTQSSPGGTRRHPLLRPNVFLGSHDPLLDWALRESGCGIATFMDGSADGLERFDHGEGIATGLHIHEPVTNTWNICEVSTLCLHQPVVLVEWGRRSRGLILHPDLKCKVEGLDALKTHRVVARQSSAGASSLLTSMLEGEGIAETAINFARTARTEIDAAGLVLEGKADIAFGLEALAAQYSLPFIPLIEERFDLLVDRKAWFEEPFQKFLAFWRTGVLELRARELTGYDMSDLGKVHFNGG